MYTSTVFACDTSSDDRYIRCDFPQCKDHGQNENQDPGVWYLVSSIHVTVACILSKHQSQYDLDLLTAKSCLEGLIETGTNAPYCLGHN